MIGLEVLNTLSAAEFVATLAGIFEHSPWIPERASSQRPFASRLALLGAMREVVGAATAQEQLGLIRAHPKLGARGRARAELTAASAREQTRAGLAALSDEEFALLQKLNAAYIERFDFPFIIAVKGHVPASILANIERRLANPPAEERRTALIEIGLIAGFRLADLVVSDPGAEAAAMHARLLALRNPAADDADSRAACVREWLLAAGFDVSRGGAGELVGRMRLGGGASAAVGEPAHAVPVDALPADAVPVDALPNDAARAAPRCAAPLGFLAGIAAVQSLRRSGAETAAGDLRIEVCEADLSDRALSASDADVAQALRRLEDILHAPGRSGGVTIACRPHQ
jgi:OHCU decarboxylase